MRAVIVAALVATGLVTVPGAQARNDRGRDSGGREGGMAGWRDDARALVIPGDGLVPATHPSPGMEAAGDPAALGRPAAVAPSRDPALSASPFGVSTPRPATAMSAPTRLAAANLVPLMTIAQLQYEGGGDWYANPTGLPNLLNAIRTRTGLPVADRPAHVKITDPDLWQYPYLYMTGHGNVHFSDEEVQLLRNYLSAGGFLHADDNYGMDVSFRREIRRIFPDAKLVELPKDHPVYHLFYDFPRGLPKIHKHDGTPAQGFGLFHDGRLVVFYSYESDLGNGWEDPQTYGDPPALHEAALRMGVNLFMYATSQVAR